MPLTVMTTIPAKYAAPKTPIPANITVRSFQIKQWVYFSLQLQYIYLREKINRSLQIEISIFVQVE